MNQKTRRQVAAALLRAAAALSPVKAKAKTSAYSDRDKMLGKNVRLTWSRSRGGVVLEELPQKGKIKLRKAALWSDVRHDAFIPENIIREQDITKNDDFDSMLMKLWDGYANAYREAGLDPARYMGRAPSVHEVHYLMVEPEDQSPFQVRGKDFVVNLSWTKFSSYSPGSDLSLHDPHYTLVESASPAAARKLYKALKVMPEALRRMSWSDFTDWLRKNGVAFDYHFSQWS